MRKNLENTIAITLVYDFGKTLFSENAVLEDAFLE
jgi:hypothetical protein